MRALTGSCAFRARASARRGDQSGTSSSSSSSSSRPPRPPRRAEPSDERRLELDRRSWTLIAATTIALSRSTTPTRAALAYGLNKPPPSNDGGFFGLGASKKPRRSYAEIMAAREEAERRREELEAEANPGVLVTMDSGLQYREMDEGRPSGKVAAKGDEMFVLYKVFRLAPGAYFKYSSGGTPILMFSQGYGYEGQDDVGEPYVFALGSDGMPRGVSPALYGMREGGKRRILVPPNAGWVNDDVKPRAPSFGASRRLANHREEPLLVEVDVLRIRKANEPASGEEDDDVSDAADGGLGFKLPAPPSPFRDRLGETRETAEASGDAGAGAVEDEPVAV